MRRAADDRLHLAGDLPDNRGDGLFAGRRGGTLSLRWNSVPVEYCFGESHGPHHAVFVQNRGKSVSRGDVDDSAFFQRDDTRGFPAVFGVSESELSVAVVSPGEESSLRVHGEHVIGAAGDSSNSSIQQSSYDLENGYYHHDYYHQDYYHFITIIMTITMMTIFIMTFIMTIIIMTIITSSLSRLLS